MSFSLIISFFYPLSLYNIPSNLLYQNKILSFLFAILLYVVVFVRLVVIKCLCSSSMLKPQPPAKPAAIELLAQAPTMDNNRLEKLVKNFVDEDKARIAAARNKSAMPSSIQYALQKFENKSVCQTDGTNLGSPVGGGAYVRKTTGIPDRKIGSGYGVGNTGSGIPEVNTYSTTNSVQQVSAHIIPIKVN